MRLRDGEQRVQKKDRDKSRDREMRSQSKRRRFEKHAPRNNSNNNRKDNKDVEVAAGAGTEESSAEESFGEEYHENYDEKAAFSTYKLNHAYHEKVTMSSSPVLRVADEITGVLVPRRARSGLVKRHNEFWNSGGGGLGEEHSRRRLFSFPLGRNINVHTRKKTKSGGPKTQIPKVSSSEPFSSVQDDIEIEVVEALFDLMKQSHSQSSEKFEGSSDNKSTEKHDPNCNKAVDDKPICSPIISAKIAARGSDLQQEIKSFSGSFLDVDAESKKKGDEDGKVLGRVDVSASNVSSNEIKPQSKEPMTLKSENSSPKLERLSPNNTVLDGLDRTREDKVGKVNDPKEPDGESVDEDDVVTKDQVSKEVARFQIDLMAPPPMPSTLDLEKDGLAEMKSKTMSKDEFFVSGKRYEGKQTQKIDVKQEHAILDFVKPHKDSVTSGYNRLQQRGQNEQAPLSESKDFVKTNLLPFPIAVTGWPGGYHPGYIDSFQISTPSDGSAKPSAQLQPLPFSLAHPRPKKSTTHKHIARSIHDHQQLTKNCTPPGAHSLATLHRSRTCNPNPAPSPPYSSLGNTLLGDLAAGQGLALTSSEVPDFLDAAKIKQLVCQQASQQSPAGNLAQGPAFILPLGQHQAIGGPTCQSGPSRSAKATGKVSLSNDSAGRPRVSSSPLPPGAAIVSFNGSNLPANKVPPLMAILQNNGYPFSISSNGGIPLSMKATESPHLPFSDASYHPSMFHVTQVRQQSSTSQPQSNCLHLVQLDSQATSTSSGSSSFHKWSRTQQLIGSQTRVHHSLMQQQQAKKQHVAASSSSSKFDKEMSRQDAAIVVNNRESCAQNASDGKSLENPVQPINVGLMSHGIADGHGGSHQRYLQQKGSKCGIEVASPPAACTPMLNFLSVSQNPPVFQMLLDVAKGRYQLVHAAQVGQHTNFQVAGGKSVVAAASNDDEKTKHILASSTAQSFSFSNLGSSNPSSSSVNEIATDGSARILNVLPSADTGTRLSGSCSSALSAVFSVNPPNCYPQQQQKELIQLPQQHIQQMEMTRAAQSWAPTSTNSTYLFSGSNLPHSNSIASQNLVQNIKFDQPSSWKNAALATTSLVSSPANTSGLQNLAQLQQINSRQTQIAFSSCAGLATTFQGQQMVINRQPASSLVDVSLSNSSLSKNTCGSGSTETTPGSHKTRSTMAALPSQQTEISLNGPSPKSSPVCGRNMPSILSTCPSQLSEIKY